MASQHPIRLFVSYSRKDKDICDRVVNHLSPLESSGRVDIWRDTDILPGGQWNREIEQQINAADIILLLISSNFTSSDFCYKKEMPIALKRERNKEAIVIPILIKDVNWQGLPFAYLDMLPENMTPVVDSGREDTLLSEISKGIEARVRVIAFEQIRKTLKELEQDESLSIISRYIFSVVTLTGRKETHPLEVYEYFVDVVEKMRPELDAGVALQEIFKQAANGDFFSEDAPPHEADIRLSVKDIFYSFYEKELETPSQAASASDSPIDVHVVLIAMTREEANALDALSAFDNQPTDRLKDNFVSFKAHLEAAFPNWKDNYGVKPEFWEPLDADSIEAENLDSLVQGELKKVEVALAEKYKQTITLRSSYQDVRVLHQQENREFLEELRRDECLIIIDAVSLYHPEIFKAFQRSLLDVYHNTFVVTYAPNGHLLREMKSMIVALEFEIKHMGFLYRHEYGGRETQRSRPPCIATSEDDRFAGWLYFQMKNTIESKSFRGVERQGIQDYFYDTSS